MLGTYRPQVFRCNLIRHVSTGQVVDEMITFARENARDNYDQAMDILKSGLGYNQTGLEAGRLQLAQAEIEADRSRWSEVSTLCRRAAAAASETRPSSPIEALVMAEVELAASLLGTRAFLTQNKDAEAFQMAQQCLEVARKSFTSTGVEDQQWQGLVLSHSIAALTQHAACDFDNAAESFDEVLSFIDHSGAGIENQHRGFVSSTSTSSTELPQSATNPTVVIMQNSANTVSSRQRDHFIPDALKQVAAFRLAERRYNDAITLAVRAEKAAKDAIELQNCDLRTESGGKGADPMLHPTLCTEIAIDAVLLQAQAYIDSKEWDNAEAKLSEAVSMAEQLKYSSGMTHIRIALVLLPLAHVYSRTGRVVLAEGLYREITKIMNLTPSDKVENYEISTIHPSIGALAAWRYAQLLTALPKRDTEASSWHRLAKDLYDDAPLRRVLEPASVFGTLDNLKGKGDVGTGVVLDLLTRRALPKAPPST